MTYLIKRNANMTLKEFLLNDLEWSNEDFEQVAKTGCQGGVGSLIYYTETNSIYEQHKDEIWAIAEQMADDMGVTTIELVASFSNSNVINCSNTFNQVLVWFAVETICQQVKIEKEELDNE